MNRFEQEFDAKEQPLVFGVPKATSNGVAVNNPVFLPDARWNEQDGNKMPRQQPGLTDNSLF